MEVDLEGTPKSAYAADVCIAGAGVAGLVLADALIGSGLRVAVLEGGGRAPETRSQELYAVEMAGRPHSGAQQGRYRTFGGSSSQWGGQLLSYTDDVFSPPPETEMAGWPLGNAELREFYPAVLRLMGVPDEDFSAESLTSGQDDVQVRFSRWAPFRKRNLGGTAGERCLKSADVTVYFHANVTRLEAEGNRVRRVVARNYAGGEFVFSAKHVVLCLGTIECSRLLLASGIGNDTDQVGRYFHDHIGLHVATLTGAARRAAARLFLPTLKSGCVYTPKLEATARWRAENAATAVMAHFPIVEAEDSPAATLRMVLQAVQRKEIMPGLWSRLLALPMGSVELARLAYATQVLKRRALSKHAELRLNIDVEQKPVAESRITLSEEKDGSGMLKARLDWRISEAELKTVRLFAKTVLRALRKPGLGEIDVQADADLLGTGTDTYHMMGGTRMGTAPAESVVDRNLRVHGIENLYVASCAVFPTGGSSNPTFTLMALALRLAVLLQRG